MRSRTESTIFIPFHVDVTKTLKYLEDLQERRGEKVSIFNIILAASARTFALRPKLNRFCNGTHLYQRNEICFSFIAKKQLHDEAKETNVKMRFSPYVTLFDVIAQVHAELHEARKDDGYYQDEEVNKFGKLPGFMIRFLTSAFRFLDKHNLAPKSMIKTDPLFCSQYITNMGSVGMKLGPHHHLFEWGNASLFLAISQHTKRPRVNEDGEVVVKDVLDMIVTWDDRIADGLYGQKSAELLKDFIENPRQLEEPPEIPQKTLDKLMLKDY